MSWRSPITRSYAVTASVAGVLFPLATIPCSPVYGADRDAPRSSSRQEEFKTLGAALAQAQVPTNGTIAISVGADRVTAAPVGEGGHTRLTAGAPVARIARHFGQFVRTYGTITAIAPPTMVLINTALDKPNIYLGMPPGDVLTILLSTLTDSQWQAVTGEQGLAVSALSTDDQRMLIRALLPEGKMTVAPWYYRFKNDYKPEDVRDLSGTLPQARLRLSQSFSVGFPARGDTRSQYQSDDIPPPADGSPRYRLTNRSDYGGSQDSLYGVPVRKTVPNREKPGQLPWSDPRLSAPVSLTGLATVGDLIGRVGTATGLDLYADPRYAALSLSIVGEGAAPARDLLRAIALCSTATYRRVGSASETRPAYILTDDLMGMGARQILWYEFEQDADALRAGPVSQAAQSLFTRFGARGVKPLGDDAALAPGEAVAAGEVHVSDRDYPPTLNKPFTELPPALQAAVERTIERHNSVYTSQPGTTDGGKISLYPQVRLEILVPSLRAPVDMNLNVSHGMLFRVPKEVTAQREAEERAQQEKLFREYLAKNPQAIKSPPAGTSVTSALPLPPRRAVLRSPKSIDEITDDIAAMQKLGLNELWLDLPYSRRLTGKISGAGKGEGAPATASSADAETLLVAALRLAGKANIRVYPVLSPFAEDAPVTVIPPASEVPGGGDENEHLRDLNMLGEDSTNAEAHLQKRRILFSTDARISHYGNDETRPIPPVYNNPLAPGFLPATEAMIRRLAQLPGIAGLVWKETDPPGYDALRGGQDMSRRVLGYNPAMRLAFLREFGADPVDLYTPNYYTGKANTKVPIQDRGEHRISSSYQKWKAFRREQNLAFLRSMHTSAGKLPILVKQRRLGPRVTYSSGVEGYLPGWYGSWDDTRKSPPTLYSPGDDYDLGRDSSDATGAGTPQPQGPPSAQARQQSKVVIDVLSVEGFLLRRSPSPSVVPSGRGASLPPPREDGFVLDLSEPDRLLTFGAGTNKQDTPRTLPELAAKLSP